VNGHENSYSAFYVLKNDFGEVDEAVFQGDEMPYEFIFCILNIEKSDLDEVA
jgi:hypothetical protein